MTNTNYKLIYVVAATTLIILPLHACSQDDTAAKSATTQEISTKPESAQKTSSASKTNNEDNIVTAQLVDGSETTKQNVSSSLSEGTEIVQETIALTVGDPVQGKKEYRQCSSCHTIKEKGRHGVGPNLWNIYGANAGQKERYRYSKALTSADIVWTEEMLDAYLEKPAEVVKKTAMIFQVKDPQKRADIIAYLKENSAKGAVSDE